MNHAGNRGEVNCAMEHLPALPAEAPNPARRGSNRKRKQKNEAQKADRDKRPFGDVFPHSSEIERLVGAKIGQEVEAKVEKSEQTQHAAETNEIRKMEELTERSDAQSKDEEAERPIACRELNEFDGVGAETVVERAPDERAERNQRKKENGDFGPFAGE